VGILLEQVDWEKINAIVSEMFKEKNIGRMRHNFLAALTALVNYDLADFYLSDRKVKPIRLIDPVVVSKYPKNFNETFMINYEKHYGAMDYARWVFSSTESIVYRESDLINPALRLKSPFYSEYLKPAGLVNVAGISIADHGVCIGAITLYRTEKNGDFSSRDLYILEQLLTHLQNRLALEQEQVSSHPEKYASAAYLLSHEYNLSMREIELIKLICLGKNNDEISRELAITVNTVKKHISNIFFKLNVDTKARLIAFLMKNDKELFYNSTNTL
jgi:DNA-binding CsgD family transcriptional regulator